MARFGRCSISSGNLNVRSGPGSNYSIVFTIAKDEVVTILSGPSGEFYRIQRGSQTGYASSTYMTELYYSNGSTARVSVSSGNVNVRSGPSTSYTAVGSLPNNTGVRVLGTISDWKQIIDENQNVGGYCLGTYITSGSDQGANYGLTLSMIRGGGYSYKLDNKTQSNDIREVQRMLTVWGYSCTQDGIYGGGTVTAVSNFQSANGLGVDGQFGQGTLKKINPNYNISLSDLSGGAVLRYDPTNDYSAVREIQTLLNKHGFSCTVDGIYGNSTVSAVKSFQTSQSLSPDGICGANTYTKLTRGHNYDITLAKIRDGGVSFKEDNITYNRDVQEVQRMLASWGYSCSIDGYYGSSTVNAMKLFQGAKGLTIDGFCGKNTLKKLQPNYGVTRDLILDAKAALQFDPTASYSTVSTMQSLLNARGASVATTGWYNDATVYAAKSFQAARGLTQDGICGKRTYEALEQSTPSGAPNSGITLQLIRSSSSPGYSFKLDLVTYKDDIKYVQLLLNEKGYSCSVTGYYDEDTEDAVKRYQSATGCSSVDGKLGRLTLASLEGSIPEVDPNPDPNDIYVPKGEDFYGYTIWVIAKNEASGKYDGVLKNDGGSLSIGIFQWHGDRAMGLLKMIKNRNASGTQSKLEGTTIYNEILNNASYSTRVLTDTEAVRVKELLRTSYGIEAQRELARNDLGTYIQQGRNRGIINEKALIYFCDMYNQSPSTAGSIANATPTPKTLDAIYNQSKNYSLYTSHKTRRDDVKRLADAYGGTTPGQPELPDDDGNWEFFEEAWSRGQLVNNYSSGSGNDIAIPGNPVYCFDKSLDIQLSTHFKLSEFRCKCSGKCAKTLVDKELVRRLEEIRKAFGGNAVNPHSGFRCKSHNTSVKGASDSQHLYGRAFDFRISGKDHHSDVYATLDAWDNIGGLGCYHVNSFNHVDVRKGTKWRKDPAD